MFWFLKVLLLPFLFIVGGGFFQTHRPENVGMDFVPLVINKDSLY